MSGFRRAEGDQSKLLISAGKACFPPLETREGIASAERMRYL